MLRPGGRAGLGVGLLGVPVPIARTAAWTAAWAQDTHAKCRLGGGSMMLGQLWVGVDAVRGLGVGSAVAEGLVVGVGEGPTCRGRLLPLGGPLPSKPCSSKAGSCLLVEQPS